MRKGDVNDRIKLAIKGASASAGFRTDADTSTSACRRMGFSDETWPGYLDAAVLIKRDRKNVKYLYFRWKHDMGAVSL